MRIIAAFLCLLALVSPARAAKDEFADLKPLLGTWDVDKDCVVNRERIVAAFSRQPKEIFFEVLDPRDEKKRLWTADIVPNGGGGHFRVAVRMQDNPVLRALGLSVLPASLNVSDDTSDADSPGKDYITVGAEAGPLSSLTTIKLRPKGRATFLFTAKTPMSEDRCRGGGVKRKPAKSKPAP